MADNESTRSRLDAIRQRRESIDADQWSRLNADQRGLTSNFSLAYAQGPQHPAYNDAQKEEAWAAAARDQAIINSLPADLDYLLQRCESLLQWVNDLQSGMYVNCVYCGHRYGPSETTPVSMADVLKAHIEQCPNHPMSKLKAENARLRQDNEHLRNVHHVTG